MRIAICDDDFEARYKYSILMQAIAHEKGIVVAIAEYETGRQLESALMGSVEMPDIILLDIFLPEYDGIEVGRRIRRLGFRGIIVYISQSPDYMLPAFDVEAFNYIIKEESLSKNERFEKVFTKAIERAQLYSKKFVLLNGITEHRNIPIESIRYFESIKHVITVYYGDNECFEFISSLDRVEKALSEFGFIRIQRSYLVSIHAIESFDFKSAVLFDGTLLPVGRKRYPELKSVMVGSALTSIL